VQAQYTPAGGNVALPTPVGVARQPPQKQGGGGRTGIIVLLLVLMVGFGGVLGYGAFHHAGSSNGGTTTVDAGEAPPIVETAELPEAEAPVTLDTNIAPLTNPKPPPYVRRDAGARPPARPPTPPGPRPPTPTPPAVPALPPGALNGQACALVQAWKNMGRDRDPTQRLAYNRLILQCNALRAKEEE
jgi:hypothetical protein